MAGLQLPRCDQNNFVGEALRGILLVTVGQYNLVSMALNTFGVQLDKGVKGF
jgi:hypothetical protein